MLINTWYFREVIFLLHLCMVNKTTQIFFWSMKLFSDLTHSLSIEFSLKELRAVGRQMIGMHELLPRGFVWCLKVQRREGKTCELIPGACRRGLHLTCINISHVFKGVASLINGRQSYVVQLLGVGKSQSHVHGIGFACEFKSAWMLTIALVIQRCFSCFGLLKIQWTNRDPTCTFIVVPVVRLVDILRKCKENTF